MSKKKNTTNYWWILGILFPFIGIILYLVWKNSKKNKANSVLTGTIIGLLIYSFLVLFFYKSKDNYVKEGISSWYNDTKTNTVVTVIGASYCSHCQEYHPIISELANKYKFNLYFFESDLLSEEDSDKLFNTYYLEDFDGHVPFTFIVKNGKVISSTTGFSNEEDIINFLSDNGIIKS